MGGARLFIVAMLMFSVFQAHAGPLPASVRLKGIVGFNVDDYLGYFLRSVPLKQQVADPESSVIYLKGRLSIDLTELREPLRTQVRSELEHAFIGERLIAGAVLDVSAAEIHWVSTLEQGGSEISVAQEPEVAPPLRPLSLEHQKYLLSRECVDALINPYFHRSGPPK